MLRSSPLENIIKPGRFGADKGSPGLTLSVIHPMTMVMVIARKGNAKKLGSRLRGNDGWVVQSAGPDQYYVMNTPYTELKEKLEGLGSVSDQSHGRVMFRIAGPKARAVLAKGTPVDVHEAVFPIGKSALTQMAHVSVHFTRTGEEEFTLSVFRGFSESFWEWLTSQAGEFGYQVE